MDMTRHGNPNNANVIETFRRRSLPPSDINFQVGSCYPLLSTCIRGPPPICLDWREICNGVYDCIDGEDEEFCYLLEQNQCSNDEFRCHRSKEGISRTFVDAQENSFDFLTTTDEIEEGEEPVSGDFCISFPTFECEEVSQGLREYFSCGDGQTRPDIMPR
ncbi:unnamed protein product, partial [Adineta ricciae]